VGIAVLCSVVGVSPASAQTYVPHWSPEVVEVDESSGIVVMTLRKHGPGPVRWRTEDGSCVGYDNMVQPPSRQCAAPARAPDDYGAVSGEVIFTEAGTRTITIPIVDDGLDEGWAEAFTVIATEVDERAGGAVGSRGTVRIIDDDGDSNDAEATTTTMAGDGQSSSGPVPTVPPVGSPVAGASEPPSATPPAPDLDVALASDELPPGPGFEVAGDGLSGPERGTDRGGSGGSAPWLGFGVVIAAVASAASVSMRRRRRSTPS
jgi:hypothetical protein